MLKPASHLDDVLLKISVCVVVSVTDIEHTLFDQNQVTAFVLHSVNAMVGKTRTYQCERHSFKALRMVRAGSRATDVIQWKPLSMEIGISVGDCVKCGVHC